MTKKEFWKEIEGTDGKYSVSNLGNVRNNGFYANVCGGGKRFVKRRLLKTPLTTAGYRFITYMKGESRLVHRMVANAFIPNPMNKEFVNHKNGIKTDNRLCNLEWCTRQENEDHAFATGLKNSTGSNNVQSKITEDDVVFILENYGQVKDELLCEMFAIHKTTLQRIVNRKIWKHVKFDGDTGVIDTHKKMLFNAETGIFYDSMVEAMRTTPYNKSHFYAMIAGRNPNRTSFIQI